MYEDGIIVPKLFYKPKIFPLAEPEDGAKKCAELLVEDLTSDRTADLSLVSQQISSQPDSKILCEEVEESRPTTREKVVVVLASPLPHSGPAPGGQLPAQCPRVSGLGERLQEFSVRESGVPSQLQPQIAPPCSLFRSLVILLEFYTFQWTNRPREL